ncbi:MAG: hypothetical protein UH853_06235 [Muribaculaceae bacterium]|nr:hypothetical protein [Muribaculaceae bacterium]
MKKIFFVLFVVSTILLQSCSSSIEGYKNYQDACAAGRFDVAHRFLAQMPKDKDKEREAYSEAEEYILKQELSYLIGLGEEQYDNRALFLLKQNESNDSYLIINLYLMAMDLAVTLDNDELMENLIKSIPYKGAALERIISYYQKAGDEKLRSFLLENLSERKVTRYAVKYCVEKKDMELFNKLLIQDPSLIESSEFIKMLASADAKRFKDIINKKISDAEGKVPSRPALGLVKSNMYGDLEDEYSEYISAVKEYNNICREALTIAIQVGDKALANSIVSKMKPNLVSNIIGDWVHVVEHEYDHSSIYNAIKVSQSNYDDINSAKKMLLNSDAK